MKQSSKEAIELEIALNRAFQQRLIKEVGTISPMQKTVSGEILNIKMSPIINQKIEELKQSLKEIGINSMISCEFESNLIRFLINPKDENGFDNWLTNELIKK